MENTLRLDASELSWSGVLDGTASLDGWIWRALSGRSLELCEQGFDREAMKPQSYSVEPAEDHRLRLTISFAVFATWQGVTASAPWEDQFLLEPVRCHLGGHRWYFICPECGTRRTRLYRTWRWACQRCLHLTYKSNQEHNRASRHGTGFLRRLRHLFDMQETDEVQRARRNYRRRVSRWRALTAQP